MVFFVSAALMSIITVIKRNRGSIIGLCFWLVTIVQAVLVNYPQHDYLIIAVGTVWTALLLAWILMINTQKERN